VENNSHHLTYIFVTGSRYGTKLLTRALSAHPEINIIYQPLAKKEISAALHPADFTGRPQIVYAESNEGYYEIIKAFEKVTGVECLLNTSFNLHGEPIVNTAKDAMRVFEKSDLDALILNNYLIDKMRNQFNEN
jgi:predicted NodU family carbamoyl transferase